MAAFADVDLLSTNIQYNYLKLFSGEIVYSLYILTLKICKLAAAIFESGLYYQSRDRGKFMLYIILVL
jgi:hypothetical protein